MLAINVPPDPMPPQLPEGWPLPPPIEVPPEQPTTTPIHEPEVQPPTVLPPEIEEPQEIA